MNNSQLQRLAHDGAVKINQKFRQFESNKSMENK